MAVARLSSRWALTLSMFFPHNPTVTSPYCHPKLPFLQRSETFFSKFQPKLSVQPAWSSSLLPHFLAHGDALLLCLVPSDLLLEECPMFPDSFALQDCLPSDSVATHMLTKEKMAFQITEIQRPMLPWNMSLWVIWPCLLEIGRIPKKWGEGVVYLTSRRLILSSLVHTIYRILMFLRGWELWIKFGI